MKLSTMLMLLALLLGVRDRCAAAENSELLTAYRAALDALLPMPERQPGVVLQVDVRNHSGIFAERAISVREDRAHSVTVEWRRPASGSIWTGIRHGKPPDVQMESGTLSGTTCPAVRKVLADLERTRVPLALRVSTAQDVETLEVRIQGLFAEHRISFPPERDDPVRRWAYVLQRTVAACDKRFVP